MGDDAQASALTPPMVRPLAAWRIRDFDPGAGEGARAFDDDARGTDWIDAPAPGDVYLALHAAGRLPHPFADRAEADCAWVKDREWWWRTDFDAAAPAAGQRLTLSFEGLDTFAEVWLNGEPIGRSDNMFRPLELDVTGRVRPGANRLAVCFTPVAAVVAGKTGPTWPFGSDPNYEIKRNLVRKAQFGWGWDWGPTLPTVGIWKPASLRLEARAAIADVNFITLEIAPDGSEARVAVTVAADVFGEAGALSARVRLTGPDGTVAAEGAAQVQAGAARIELVLSAPRLWWTLELGEPDLYALDVTLLAGAETLDRRALKVGVRTIALDQSPDPDEAGATFFRFVLNGVPIFARGACWIPASSFVAVVDEAHYRRLLAKALDANMNMIRIWGGGVYEHDAFYDLCDELGLLVWQDFMFACAPYPDDDPAFVENVSAEVRDQVTRLRRHPCLALWCGNNENQVIQSGVNAMTHREDPLAGARLYDEVMPAIAAELDPFTPYWPGSPWGGPHPNSMIAGDVHDWTVWHGMPPVPVDQPVGKFSLEPEALAYTRYAEDMARFVSEYGIQASPAMETLKRALPEDQRTLGGPALLARIKDRPKNKVDSMLVTVTGLPSDLQEYVDFTQITQAEGLKFGIEHFRRRTPHCAGSLIWQLNDCWPGISWSLIDYYGFGKASFYYVRRAYAPVMASFKPADDGAMELWVVNDTRAPARGAAQVALESFAGPVLWRTQVSVDVGPTESRCVWRGEAKGGAGEALAVTADAGLFPANRRFFVPIKDLDRSAVQPPAVRMEPVGPDALAVTLTTATRLWFVHLLAADEAVWFEDNYFDLAAGETRTIAVRNPGGALAPEDITVRWR